MTNQTTKLSAYSNTPILKKEKENIQKIIIIMKKKKNDGEQLDK